MKALAALFSALVFGALVAVPTAGSTRPDRSFLPNADTVITDVCSFDVDLHVVQNNEYVTTFSDGHFIVTGALMVRLTNLSDPTHSMIMNIPGPGIFTPGDDGSLTLRAVGPWLFWFTADQLYPGSPAIFLFSRGNSTLSFDANGTGTFAPSRNSTDICAALS
jgi:hypothetical protein